MPYVIFQVAASPTDIFVRRRATHVPSITSSYRASCRPLVFLPTVFESLAPQDVTIRVNVARDEGNTHLHDAHALPSGNLRQRMEATGIFFVGACIDALRPLGTSPNIPPAYQDWRAPHDAQGEAHGIAKVDKPGHAHRPPASLTFARGDGNRQSFCCLNTSPSCQLRLLDLHNQACFSLYRRLFNQKSTSWWSLPCSWTGNAENVDVGAHCSRRSRVQRHGNSCERPRQKRVYQSMCIPLPTSAAT
jgi:hypothetical protein